MRKRETQDQDHLHAGRRKDVPPGHRAQYGLRTRKRKRESHSVIRWGSNFRWGSQGWTQQIGSVPWRTLPSVGKSSWDARDAEASPQSKVTSCYLSSMQHPEMSKYEENFGHAFKATYLNRNSTHWSSHISRRTSPFLPGLEGLEASPSTLFPLWTP